MKILVTGHKGFIGSHMAQYLQHKGHEVEGFDYVENVVPTVEPYDWVVHCGAISDTTERDVDKVWKHNYEFTLRLLQICDHYGTNIQIASTAAVYGPLKKEMFSETDPVYPQTPYAWSKYLIDKFLLDNDITQFKMNVQSFRYFNVYGPREPLKGQYAPVVGLFKRMKESGEKLTIVGDGEQRRDFTYVKDVVRANIMASDSKVYHGLFNIGTGRNYSINQVADLVGGEKSYIPSRAGEARETMADISKATQILGWSPNHRLEDTVLSY